MFIDLHLGALHEPLTGRSWSSAQATQEAGRCASHLRRLGVKRGDCVFLHYGNTPEFFFDVVALWSLGASLALVDPRFTAYEVEKLARWVRPSFSIWSSEPDHSFTTPLQSLGVRVLHSRADDAVASDRDAWRSGLPQLDDDALLLFTSGTTGEPKCVVHTHRSLRARWSNQRERLGVAAYERTLCLLPTHFAWGLIGNCLYPWLSGQSLYVAPALRTDVILQLGKLCDEYAITSLPTVPATWRLVLKTVAPPRKRTLRRVSCGTAPLAAALSREISEWSGADEVLNVYGITETGWIAGVSSADMTPEDNLVGESWGCIVRILEDGLSESDPLLASELGCGKPGSIWVQAPSLMKGYFMRDDLTRQAVSRGWFCTGDVGLLDDRGLLYLLGRDKEMINVGGIKIYPNDIDIAVALGDGVLDVCTFGFEDPLHGENIGIAVVLQERSEEMLGRLWHWTVMRLARHQLPRRWYLVDEIARSARGKLIRSEVARSCEALTPIEQRTLERGARPAPSDVDTGA